LAAPDPGGAAKPAAPGAADANAISTIQLIYQVHEGLARLIAPATVVSLLATEPVSGKERNIFRGLPRIVQFAAWVAVICAVGFVWTASRMQTVADKLQTAAEGGGAPAAGHTAVKPAAKEAEPSKNPTNKEPDTAK
jgi:hypothetical protein